VKKPIANSALLAVLCAATLSTAAQANRAQVEHAEQQVRAFEQKSGQDNSDLADLLLSLASAYQSNGEREKAELTYKRALGIAQKEPDTETAVPDLMMSWAGRLIMARHTFHSNPRSGDASMKREEELSKSDQIKAEQIIKEAMALYDRLPQTDESRLWAHEHLVDTMRFTGNFASADAEEHRLQKLLTLIEPLMTSTAQISTLAQIYDSLATSHTTSGGHQSGDGTPLRRNENVPAATPSCKARNVGNRPLAQADFNIAEMLKVKALSLWDKLPDSDRQRKIVAHRDMVQWYKLCGKDKEAKEQTEALSKLVGTSDPSILFKVRPPCSGCGMG
jgi:tetratricopeptide (TPR) repeat protein